jgi:hypothetical protein
MLFAHAHVSNLDMSYNTTASMTVMTTLMTAPTVSSKHHVVQFQVAIRKQLACGPMVAVLAD